MTTTLETVAVAATEPPQPRPPRKPVRWGNLAKPSLGWLGDLAQRNVIPVG